MNFWSQKRIAGLFKSLRRLRSSLAVHLPLVFTVHYLLIWKHIVPACMGYEKGVFCCFLDMIFMVMEKAFTSFEYPVFRVTVCVQELQLSLIP